MAKSEEGLTDHGQGLPIRITLKDGRIIDHRTSRGDILGAQGNPWGFDNIKNKFECNAGLALSRDRVQATVDTGADIGAVPDLADNIQKTLVRLLAQERCSVVVCSSSFVLQIGLLVFD